MHDHSLAATIEREIATAQLDAIEAAMYALPHIPAEPVHHFADGLYARELTIPAGGMLVGKVHRTEHLLFFLKGRMTIWDAQRGIQQVVAPCTVISKPGVRRLGLAHEDTVCTCVHANPDNERDLIALEARYIEPHEVPPELIEHFQQVAAQASHELSASVAE